MVWQGQTPTGKGGLSELLVYSQLIQYYGGEERLLHDIKEYINEELRGLEGEITTLAK